jgi:penicillin amidase
MKKVLISAGLALVFLILGFIFLIFFSLRSSLPKIQGEIRLEALASEVKVIRDEWGVPHIFAANEKDLFFAAGYIHAQDRMWQMELSRRAGFGRLSEVFGKQTLDRDKFLRNIGLKEAARKEYENLSPAMKEPVHSYCEGVNAWIRSRKYFNWPPEFLILRHRPEPWTILDSLVIKEIMAFLLSGDYQSEALRAKLAGRLGPQKALEILEEDAEAPFSTVSDIALSHLGEERQSFQGSNNWVIGGSRTQSGKPLLANDPHLEISVPPIWYEIHLCCPTINVTGVSLPGVPVVVIGHNESIAWGITNSGADVQDLFIERLDARGENYADGEVWRPLLKKEELIRIRGKKEPERMVVSWTGRGPIITPLIVKGDQPLSLEWVIQEGGHTFEAFYRLNKAGTWDEFQAALRLFDSPSQNFVYADVYGNIGYYLSGRIPLRPKNTALFPYPGWRGEGQWNGFLSEELKPTAFNPEQGYIITANNRIIPDDYAYYISCEWDVGFRAERIKELILGQAKHTAESQKRLQNDVRSKEAELFLPLLRNIPCTEEKARKAQALLNDWDLEVKSAKAAALYEIFMKIFHEEVFRDELGEDYQDFFRYFQNKKAGLLRILQDSSSPWFDNKKTAAIEAREDIIRTSLARSYASLEEKYGPPEKWDWMRMNSIKFEHALGQVPFLKFFNAGTFPLEGDGFTVRVFLSRGKGASVGASYRQIIDLGDFRNSLSVLTSGQSGHFLSRNYDNQIPLWLKGEYHPMLFFPEDIEAGAVGTFVLKPLKK